MDQATPRSPPDRSLDHLLPPTPRQRNAIYALNPSGSPENDRKVLDWLELTRSFWKKFGEDSDFGCPSYKEAVALFTLASYDDENIREWLRQSHAPGECFRLIYIYLAAHIFQSLQTTHDAPQALLPQAYQVQAVRRANTLESRPTRPRLDHQPILSM